jgi:tetratricopeptide (TPR) repeat protein
MSEAPSLPLPDFQVPGYRIERTLGRGGFGIVLAGTSSDGEKVALKIANAGDSVAAAQLAQEEKALRAVGSPAAPAVRASGSLADGSPFLALELIDAPTLAQRLREGSGPLVKDDFAALALDLCSAVGAMHAAGWAHFDLKPQNVFLTPEGVRLIDFGLARELGGRHDRIRAFAGTAEYASPEQCEERPDLDARADVYSLGVLLFEMLAGRPPFSGDAQSVREAHIGVRPPKPSRFAPVPNALEEVVLRALAKDRSQRFGTVAALRSALQTALAEKAPTGHQQEVAASPAATQIERRQVALLFFASAADPGSVQAAVRSLGGELGFAGKGRYATIFASEARQDPVRLAFRAAQGLADRKLAVRMLVDLGSVNAQRRTDRQLRYLAPELGRAERYAKETDPLGPLATTAAAEVLADVEWEPLPGRSGILVPRPGTMDRLRAATVVQLGAGPLVGREELLRSLLAAAARSAANGAPVVATVIAEPGNGKTHLAAVLIEKLRTHLPAAELLDLRAREPVAGDADETLRALLHRALDLPPGASEESVRARFVASVGPELGAELWSATALTLRFVSAEDPRVRSLAEAPGALRSLATRSAGEAIRARTRRGPLCVVLDDAQFADDTSLDALEYASLAEARAPLFVCALARPSFAEARKSFGERAASREVHQLGALQPARAAELCRQLLAPAENVPKEAVDLLVQRTQGVPLLLVELVRGLKRDGLVRKRARGETWFLATDELKRLPDSPLIDWLAQREVSALPRELASHAQLAALLGLEFTTEEADGVVAELDAEGLGADFPLDAQVATRRLAGLGLLVAARSGAFRFRHALVREAIAGSVAAANRKPVHRAAARFYRTTRALPDVRRLPLLARHAADAGLASEAAALYLQLADGARERHAYLDAESSYTSALALLPESDSTRRLGCFHGRGSVRYRTGHNDDALEDLERARQLAADSLLQAEILLEEATLLDWSGDYPRSAAAVEKAAELTAPSPTLALRAKLALGRGRSLSRAGRRRDSCVLLEEALRLAEAAGEYETLIISLVMLVYLFPDTGRVREGEQIAKRAIATALERGDRVHAMAALGNQYNLYIVKKDVEGALANQREALVMARELGLTRTQYVSERNLSECLYYCDRLDEAAEHARRAIEIETRHPEVANRPLGLLQQARIEAYRGDMQKTLEVVSRIRELLRNAVAEGRAAVALSPPEDVLLAAAELCTRDSATAEWEALLERSSRDSLEQEPIEIADLYGTWALRHGRMEEARRAFTEAAARAARIPNVMDERIQKGLAATAA